MESPANPATRPARSLRSSLSNTSRRPRRLLLLRGGARRGAAIFISFIAAAIIYSASFVAPTRSADAPRPAAPAGRKAVAKTPAPPAGNLSVAVPGPAFALAPVFQAGEETVATYAAGCVTPKTEFDLGETVCVKVSNAPAPFRVTRPLRRIAWVGPANVKRQQADITANPETNSFTLPGSLTSSISGESVDNRGEWTVVLTGTSDGSAIAKAAFVVKDPNHKAANLSVAQAPISGEVNAGSNAGFRVYVSNRGPDDAVNVQMTAAVPSNATFVSGAQAGGPTFACSYPSEGSTGDTTCSITSLPAATQAVFTLIYEVGSTVPARTIISHTAAATASTTDPRPLDNTSTAEAIVKSAAAGAECRIECPVNITATADTSLDPDGDGPAEPVPGALVTFDAAEPFGSCGTITASHPSGSFFPVGTTTVTSSSSEGGGFCSFDVTVVEGVKPVISCPADVTVPETSPSSDSAVVTYTVTATDDGGTPDISCSHPSGSKFEVGTTNVVCTATDSSGNTSTCDFDVTVTERTDGGCALGTTPPTPNAASLPMITRSCSATLLVADDPTATDSCGDVVSGETTDARFYNVPGDHTVTWTYTDGAGNTAAQTQVIRILPDNQAPVPDEPSLPTVTGACSVTLIKTPTAHDNCAGLEVQGEPLDAIAYDTPGTYTVRWKFSDPAGNSVIQEQAVVVIDDAPPTITAPADKTVNADPASCAVSGVALGTASADDNCSVTVTNDAPASFPLGTTVVTWTATDRGGKTATDTQTVTVVDVTKPVITRNGAATMTVECHTPFTDPGATAADACDSDVPVNASGAVDVNTPGTYTITYNASDDAGNAATPVTLTVSVVDTTAPAVTPNGSATMSVECHTSFTDPGASALDSCAGATPVVTTGSVDVNTPGTYVLTYTSTDGSGNTGSATRTVNVVDTTPPVMSCPANIVVNLPLNSTATSMAVTYPAATAIDSCGGALPVTYSKASGSVFGVGPTVVTATTTDAYGNTASCSFTVTVLYNFTGFFSPVSNLPTINSVNAGRTIPLKFSLSGNKGLGIMAAGFPASQQVACNSSAPLSELEGTETSGGSTLTYSPDQYHYNWKTEGSWAGTCRALVVKLNDGTEHTALFKFK